MKKLSYFKIIVIAETYIPVPPMDKITKMQKNSLKQKQVIEILFGNLFALGELQCY